MSAGKLFMRDGHFVDQQGRVQFLRGVNLGGSSKLPYGYGHTDDLDARDFFDAAKTVSFVNRPFPLEDADVHFAQLQRWGLTFLRLIITWEAIEHEGPGIYDYAYIQYIRDLIKKADEYGMQIYVDPHQDVWSRWTGGDGAPMWTLESVGFEPRNFEKTKAAICIETYGGKASDYPKMIWPTNVHKLACATMFTLFWAGSKFAPNCFIHGVQVQEYLQSHYINAMVALAKSLTNLPNVAGFGSMNEPCPGYIGVKDITEGFGAVALRKGLNPTPFDGMCLGEGYPRNVERWEGGMKTFLLGRPDAIESVQPGNTRAWQNGKNCIWKDAGVWRIGADGAPEAIRKDYFAHCDFGTECYVPFAARYAKQIQSVLPNAMLFAEMPPIELGGMPFPDIDPQVVPNAVNAMHWYDGVTLLLCKYMPSFTFDLGTSSIVYGRDAVRKLHEGQIKHVLSFGKDKMHNAPSLVGEVGIPYNLSNGYAFKTGDFSEQEEALDRTISCLEANMANYTLWCYATDNKNGYGDLWNLEDLSLVSPDQQKQFSNDRDGSARALYAFARPCPQKVAGLPRESRFSKDLKTYELKFDTTEMTETTMEGATEVFVPHVHYREGYTVHISDGSLEVQKNDGYEILCYRHDPKVMHHELLIETKDPLVKANVKAKRGRSGVVITTGLLMLTAALRVYYK